MCSSLICVLRRASWEPHRSWTALAGVDRRRPCRISSRSSAAEQGLAVSSRPARDGPVGTGADGARGQSACSCGMSRLVRESEIGSQRLTGPATRLVVRVVRDAEKDGRPTRQRPRSPAARGGLARPHLDEQGPSRHPEMAEHLDAVLKTIREPDHAQADSVPGRERLYRRGAAASEVILAASERARDLPRELAIEVRVDTRSVAERAWSRPPRRGDESRSW